ncbi:MAG: hypothetical protein M3303_07040 [Gemmatimonadota bacterium]|nr:hypothetical protein [Gemmatimonadota bacterium]
MKRLVLLGLGAMVVASTIAFAPTGGWAVITVMKIPASRNGRATGVCGDPKSSVLTPWQDRRALGRASAGAGYGGEPQHDVLTRGARSSGPVPVAPHGHKWDHDFDMVFRKA